MMNIPNISVAVVPQINADAAQQGGTFKSYAHMFYFDDFTSLMQRYHVGQRMHIYDGAVSKGRQQYQLTLFLYPAGYDKKFNSHIAVRASVNPEIRCQLEIRLAVCGLENEELYKKRIVLNKENGYSDLMKKFISTTNIAKVREILKSDRLTIACHLLLSHDATDGEVKSSTQIVPKRVAGYIDAFERLFKHGLFSDFKIETQTTTFEVHRSILVAHSPVFRAMLTSDMSEKNKSSVDVPDIQADTMKELLRFVYTAKVQRLDELAPEIWFAADKYEINALKEICEDKIIEHLDVKSIVEILQFLNRANSSNKLTKAVIQFMIDQSETVINDDKCVNSLYTLSAGFLAEFFYDILKMLSVPFPSIN